MNEKTYELLRWHDGTLYVNDWLYVGVIVLVAGLSILILSATIKILVDTIHAMDGKR